MPEQMLPGQMLYMQGERSLSETERISYETARGSACAEL